MKPFPTPKEALDRYGPTIGIKEVMEICGVGRPTATMICKDSECPKVPRKKNGAFIIYTGRFVSWISGMEPGA